MQAHPQGSGLPLSRAVLTPPGTTVTSTEGYSANNPSLKVKPIDTTGVVWGKAEQVIKAGVEARSGKAMVLTVAKVKDGDTVELKGGGGKTDFTCRLDGIDAPETAKDWKNPPEPGQAYGEEAKNQLIKLIDSKQVSVTVTKAQDKYGRTVCQIDAQGKDLTAEMIRSGSAYMAERFWKDAPDTVEQEGTRTARRVLQQAAIDGKKGIFGLGGQQAPSDYRRTQQKLQERMISGQ